MSTLLVADGNNFLHRAFWAQGGLTNKDGNPTGAVRGLINILLADIKRVDATHCAVIFDRKGRNFRHKLYPEYKAGRSGGPDLSMHVLPTKRLLNAMGIRVFGIRGVEGDDLVGSIAYKFRKKADVYIASTDKDFAQFVDKRVRLLRPKGVVLGAAEVVQEYGVEPRQIVDYLMMIGDKVDNVPGIDKIGPKTASKLLAKHGTLDNVLKYEKFSPKMQPHIDAAKKRLALTRKLITIDTSHLPNTTLDSLRFAGLQPEFHALCEELDFRTTKNQIIQRLKGR